MDSFRRHPSSVKRRRSARGEERFSVTAQGDETLIQCAARAENLMAIRGAVADAAVRAGLPFEQQRDLILAVGEAASNAVEYGSPRGARDRITVRCRAYPGGLLVEVQDEGLGFTPPAAEPDVADRTRPHGRGLPFIRRLVDRAEFLSSPRGTRVRLYQGLPID